MERVTLQERLNNIFLYFYRVGTSFIPHTKVGAILNAQVFASSQVSFHGQESIQIFQTLTYICTIIQ